MNITAVVLTKNEEKNIEKCLKSLDFCHEVIIIDDYSTDATLEKIPALPAGRQNQKSKIQSKPKIQIFKRNLRGDFANQRNFGLSKATCDWVLFIDADEELTPVLKKEITSLLSVISNDTDAYYIKRRDFFWGKELKYGEVAKVARSGLIRLVKKDSGKWMGNVHEVFHTAKKCKTLVNHIDHHPHQTLAEFIKDINNYSTLRAEELQRQGKETNLFEITLMPLAKFILNYIVYFGFLDGASGFTYSFMMSFHSFLVRAKLYQYTKLNSNV